MSLQGFHRPLEIALLARLEFCSARHWSGAQVLDGMALGLASQACWVWVGCLGSSSRAANTAKGTWTWAWAWTPLWDLATRDLFTLAAYHSLAHGCTRVEARWDWNRQLLTRRSCEFRTGAARLRPRGGHIQMKLSYAVLVVVVVAVVVVGVLVVLVPYSMMPCGTWLQPLTCCCSNSKMSLGARRPVVGASSWL